MEGNEKNLRRVKRILIAAVNVSLILSMVCPAAGMGSQVKAAPAAESDAFHTAAQTEDDEAALHAVEMLPRPDSSDVNPEAAVVVTFDQPVVPLTNEQSRLPAAFTLQPKAKGRAEWLNTSTYIFYPDPPLTGGVDYLVSLNTGLTSTTGAGLASGEGEITEWSFRTAAPRLESVSPDGTKGTIDLDQEFELAFNQRMDPNSVQRNLSLQDGSGRKAALTFSWEANNTMLTVTPVQLLARDTEYTLALRGEALSAGGTPLGESLAQEYTTVPRLEVEALPTYDIRPKGNHYSFFLHMTAPLDPYQDLGDLVQISPAGIVVESSISQYYETRAINIGGFFEPNQAYTITLSEDLKDRWGQPIAGEKQLTFRTAPLPASLNIPMRRYENTVTFMPGETLFFVEVNNVSSIHFNLAQLSLEEYIHVDSSSYKLEENVTGIDLNTWQVEVDTPADQYTVVQLPLQENGEALATGLYYYHLQSPQVEGPLYVSTPFLVVVSPLSMTMKRSERDVFLWVVDLRDQTPLSGKQVSFYGEDKDIIGTAITAEDGSCMVTLPEEFDVSGPVYAVIGQSGDPGFGFVTDDWEVGGYIYPRDGMRQVYLYTDRPIYRPGQTVNFRVVMRDEDGGDYALPPSGQVSVRMLSGITLYTYPEEIDIVDLSLSSYGTAAGSITLPVDAQPGYYTLDVLGEGGRIEFQVANYRKPEVDVQVTFEKDDWQVGEDVTANVLAEYYFGAPAGDVDLTWTLYGRTARFDPGDGYRAGGQLTNSLSFNDEGDDYYYSDFGSWITDGTAKTDANGAVAIQINNQDILERISAENLYSLTLEVTIQDEEEMPLSVHGSANLHPAPFYIGLRAENWVGQAGKEAGFSVLTTDWQKEISGGHILHAQFQKITWEQTKTVGWSLERHLPVFTTVSSADLSTDEKGRARLSFVPPEPGMYALKVFGEGAVSQYLLWVTGSQRTRWPSFPDQTLVLTADKELYQPGDGARIFVPNPFGGKNLALITVEREKVLYSEVVEIEGSSYEWELPLTDEHAPNVFVTVTLLGEQSEGVPSFYYGKMELAVEPVSKILEVDILTSPEQTEPGGEVTFDIQVRDSEGKPVQGEFSLAVVDKAVLALAEEDGPDMVEAFYSPWNLRVVSSLSLKIAATRIYETYLGIGGGGGGEEDIKIPHVREHFEDTALWLGSVETNASGIATVQMDLPDNLTTWVADLRGVTRDTKVGFASSEIVVSKPLLIRPQTPRFFVAGDHTALSAVVHNTTDQKLTVDVVLRSKGIVLDKGMHSQQQVVLAAGARETITWWGTIQDVEEVELVFMAQSGDLQDVTRPAQGKLPVLRYQVPASYVTAGMLTESSEQLETVQLPTTFTPAGGDLEIELSPSLAASMVGDQEVLEVHSRDFTENIVSHLLQSLMLHDFAERQGAEYGQAKDELQGEVEVSLARLLREQNLDGGWGWMAEKDSDAYISTYALFGLWRVQEAGFHLPPEKLDAATRYVATVIISPNAEKLSWQMDREVFREYVLHLVRESSAPNTGKLLDHRKILSPWSLALLALMVDEIEVGEQPDNDNLSMDKSDGQKLLNDLEGMAIRSASGAHWEETGKNRFYNCSTAQFNTAVAVYALAQINPASPLVRDGVRYLVSQMQGDGRWASGYETTWVLMALMETMEASSDFNPQYGYEVNLNGQTLLSGEMEDSGLDTLSISVLMEDLRLEDLNELKISRDDGSGTLYYRALLNLERPAEEVEAEQHGLSISRSYYGVGEDCTWAGCPMIDSVVLGTNSGMVEVRVVLTLPTEMSSLVVEDFIPAGMEVSDPSLKISKAERMPAYWDLPAPEDEYDPRNPFAEGWGWWYFGQPNIYDDHLRWVGRQVPAGTYVLTYRIQAVRPGEYRVLPARAYEYYFPDVRGNSAGQVFTVE